MMGSRMTYEFDAARGRAVGSTIKMGGNFLCLALAVEEVVTHRDPPHCKAWETRGRPHLLSRPLRSHLIGVALSERAEDRRQDNAHD